MSHQLTRVYLARHGQTALNADGRLRGLSDPPLDEVGVAEAQRLAEVLGPMSPSAVISSPLQRAVATASWIAEAAGVEVYVDGRLNDRDYGAFTGKRRADVEAEFGSVDEAPGVEPLAELTNRAREAFDQIVTEHCTDPIVVVSHDAFNRALLSSLDSTLVEVSQRTACWNQLSLVNGVWNVDVYDQKPTL